MPLIFINGMSGTGKSAVCSELNARGHIAFDVDSHGFGASFNKATGKIVTILPVSQRTKDWLDAHVYRIIPEAVKKLKSDHKDELVFLCGSASNENEVWNFLDKVIFLDVEPRTLKKRILSRTGNDFGKSDIELQMILNWQTGARENNKNRGASIVDANKPLGKVVDKILSIAKLSH